LIERVADSDAEEVPLTGLDDGGGDGLSEAGESAIVMSDELAVKGGLTVVAHTQHDEMILARTDGPGIDVDRPLEDHAPFKVKSGRQTHGSAIVFGDLVRPRTGKVHTRPCGGFSKETVDRTAGKTGTVLQEPLLGGQPKGEGCGDEERKKKELVG
jgi:hypothetical protein